MSQTDTEFHVFYSSIPSMQIIDKKGQPIIFVSSRFHTRDKSKIEFLNEMIADGSTAVFVRPDQLTLGADELDPMTVLRKKHIQEYLEEQARQLNPEANVSQSVQGPLQAASTADIAPVAAGGGATALNSTLARLAAVKANAAATPQE